MLSAIAVTQVGYEDSNSKPCVIIVMPAEFAARVVQALPPVAASRPRVAVGRTTAIAGVVVLTAALFALAPHAQPSFASFGFDVELLLMAQLCGIAYWLGKEQGLGVRG